MTGRIGRRASVWAVLMGCSTLPSLGWAESDLGMFLGEVVSNATYKSTVVATAFPRAGHEAESKGIEDQGIEFWGHLAVDSDTFIGDNWAFGLGVEAIASTYRGAEQGLFTAASSRSGRGRFVDLSRFTLRYMGESVETLVGKDDVPIGVAELYSPTDIYSRQNNANPQHSVDYGVWQARADIYFGNDRLSAVILPIEEKAPGAAEHSRWNGGSETEGSVFSSLTIPGLPAFVTADIQDDVRGSAPSDWGYLLQYKGMGTGLDYFTTLYNGPGPYPVLKTPQNGNLNPYYIVYPRVVIASAGAAITEGGWKVYGEGMGYWASGDRDEDLTRMVIGAKYRETKIANSWGLNEISPVMEFSKEWRQDEQDSLFYVVSSAKARPNPNNIIMSLTVEVSDEWKFGGGYNRNLTDRDAVSSAYVQYEPNDNLSMTLAGTEYHGRDETLFGRYSRYDNVELSVSYSF